MLTDQCVIVSLREPIPYRVVEKMEEYNVITLIRDCDARCDPKAPPSLTIDQKVTEFLPPLNIPPGIAYFNALLHCDEIYVTKFQTNFKSFPSKIMFYWDENNKKFSNLISYGTVLIAKHERSFAINHEEGYITATYSNPEDDIFQCWSTDVKHFCQRELPPRLFATIPRKLVYLYLFKLF
uniref:Uncharacterized protein n=1 Tax=Panagrolaimus superbus TaxID=310955 RepID=A0A914YKS2_9BILA